MEDDRQERALALLDYVESKQRAAMLRGQIKELEEFLRGVRTQIKTDPSKSEYYKFTVMPQAVIDALERELAELETMTENLRKRASAYGVPMG